MSNAVEGNRVQTVIGMADAYALLSAAFVFPNLAVAEAVADGSLVADMTAIAADASLKSSEVDALRLQIEGSAASMTPEELLKAMRVDYSALFYAPGKFRKIYPYESIFKRRAISPTERAAAFITKSTHDVEHVMDAHGALPINARREPADFFATELDFMRHLLTEFAIALSEKQEASSLRQEASDFFSVHIHGWIPTLFEKIIELSELSFYQVLAKFGLVVLGNTSQLFELEE